MTSSSIDHSGRQFKQNSTVFGWPLSKLYIHPTWLPLLKIEIPLNGKIY
jgi:hypothetical protein